jgi:flagellar assembly protein FliH
MATTNMSDPQSPAERWEAPALEGDCRSLLTAGELEAMQEAAYQEAWQEAWEKGLEAGRAEGLQRGAADIRERCDVLDGLIRQLEAPLADLDDEVEAALVDMIGVMMRRLFRRHLQMDPKQIIGLVQEAMRALPIAARDVSLHAHPEDARLIEEAMSIRGDGDEAAPGGGTERRWRLVEEPAISRGGFRVTSATSQIDAQAETRIEALIGSLFGDERS